MDAQSPFHSFIPAVPVGRRQDVTSPLSAIPFLSSLSSFTSLFSLLFFFANPRGERKGRVARKEWRFFFPFFREQTREHWRSLTNSWTRQVTHLFPRKLRVWPVKSVRNTRFAALARFFDRFARFCRRASAKIPFSPFWKTIRGRVKRYRRALRRSRGIIIIRVRFRWEPKRYGTTKKLNGIYRIYTSRRYRSILFDQFSISSFSKEQREILSIFLYIRLAISNGG